MNAVLLHELAMLSADAGPDAVALKADDLELRYGDLAASIGRFAGGLASLAIQRSNRVAIYLDKRFEFVIACFGASAAGAVFVPVNPLLKPEQVCHILRDCNASMLITSDERYRLLRDALADCPELRHVALVGSGSEASDGHFAWLSTAGRRPSPRHRR